MVDDRMDDYEGCANFDRFGACMCSSGIHGMCRFHERSGCCKGHVDAKPLGRTTTEQDRVGR